MPTTDRKLRVFLCHSSQDKPIVRELYQRLNAEGWIDPWLDEEKLLPGQDWDLEIEKAVEAADAVVVCLSNNSVTKEGYVQRELKFVLGIALEKPEGTIFIIPLRLDDCQVPRRLRSWQYVDYFPTDHTKNAYERVLDSLKLRATKFGLSIGKFVPDPKSVPSNTNSPKIVEKLREQEKFRNNIWYFFNVRFSDKETITYRKTPLKLAVPTMCLMIILAISIVGIHDSYLLPAPIVSVTGTNRGIFFAFWFASLLIELIWWIYQYSDWINNIYQITSNQILDIHRRPFGMMERCTVAQLENITETNYEQSGILRLLFNYGTVHIMVGDSKMAFEDVFEPSVVKLDIDRHRMTRNAELVEAKIKAEGELECLPKNEK